LLKPFLLYYIGSKNGISKTGAYDEEKRIFPDGSPGRRCHARGCIRWAFRNGSGAKPEWFESSCCRRVPRRKIPPSVIPAERAPVQFPARSFVSPKDEPDMGGHFPEGFLFVLAHRPLTGFSLPSGNPPVRNSPALFPAPSRQEDRARTMSSGSGNLPVPSSGSRSRRNGRSLTGKGKFSGAFSAGRAGLPSFRKKNGTGENPCPTIEKSI